MKQRQGLLLAASCAALGLATISLPASAQFAKPEDAIKYRKAAFTVMAAHFGRLGAMVNGKVPFDAKAAADNAAVVASVSALPFTAFGEGTDKGDTHAKPEVWSDAEKFKAAAAKLQDEVAKLNTAAKSGNADQLKSAFGATAQACKGCHDTYRKE